MRDSIDLGYWSTRRSQEDLSSLNSSVSRSASTVADRKPPSRMPISPTASPATVREIKGSRRRTSETETPRHHDVECIGDVILTEKSLAAWNVRPLELSIEGGKRRRVKCAQERYGGKSSPDSLLFDARLLDLGWHRAFQSESRESSNLSTGSAQ